MIRQRAALPGRHRSIRPATLLLLVATAASQPGSAIAGQWRAIGEVTGAPPVRVLVKGKPRVYYRVGPSVQLAFAVKGPGRIRVISRAALPAGAVGPAAYRVRLADGRRTLKEHATESSPAPKARLKESSEVICKSRGVVVDVPAGEHKLSLTCEGTPAVLVRILVAGPPPVREEMISIAPVEAARSVTVSEGERLIPYYTVAAGKPVRFQIIGPTRLELTARLDFDATMRGDQPYKIAIFRAGKKLREAKLRTTKSATATYTDLKDRVPSKTGRIALEVGSGSHDITVKLIEPRSGSVEIHARIPQPKVGSQE